MNILRDAPVLWQLAKGVPNDGRHKENLASFYAPQAERYDAFRERLLHGRGDLVARLDVAAGAHVVELGAGTGRNFAFFGDRAARFASFQLVDICAPLLDVARERFTRNANVHVIEADAETFQPREQVDCVYFCYSLSMMRDWAGAVRNALRMLKPGGLIGVVDFYLPNHAAERSGWRNRFWSRWFRRDGVYLSTQLLPYLKAHSHPLYVSERRAGIPYLPLLRAPYLIYVGRGK